MNFTTKLTFLAIILSLFTSNIYAEKISPENAVISIIIVDEGEPMYSSFGHAAIRIKDDTSKQDFVFNYGTFNFNTPNFYPKFVTGKLDYMLAVSTFRQFQREYSHLGRDTRELVLNLSTKQKAQIIQALATNLEPQNKYYKYDFLYDNCSSRIYDIILKNPLDTITVGKLDKQQSFRTMMMYYLEKKPWLKLGINIMLGRLADKTTNNAQSAFLPHFLEEILLKSTTLQNNQKIPLVKQTRTIFKYQHNNKNNPYTSPQFVLIVITILVFMALYSNITRKNNNSILAQTILILYGITGIFFLSMWAFTEHHALAKNISILWTSPLNLPIVAMFKKPKFQNIVRKYLATYNIILTIFIFAIFIAPTLFDINYTQLIIIQLLASLTLLYKNIYGNK